MINKLRKKLRSKKGFTLVELLVTVIVMLLVTEIISLTIQLSVKYYTKSVRASESQVVCSALATAVQEELQYATKISSNTSGYTYYSRARQHGSGCTIVTDGGKVYIKKGSDLYGIVGSKTYTYDLAAALTTSWDDTDKFFDVTIQVGPDADHDGTLESVLATQEFTVYPLNKGK